tara:strand:- start:106 stop:513 length:408 start_codon:yes stop_codon:yes gene_type:complete
MTGKVTRISISTPKETLEEFDEIVKEAGYDRSKAIQQAMKNFITDHKWTTSKKKNVAGVVIFIYDHEITGLEETLTDIQHKYASLINSTLHLHLEKDECLQIVAVNGPSEKIQTLSQDILAKRGIKQLKYAIVAP